MAWLYFLLGLGETAAVCLVVFLGTEWLKEKRPSWVFILDEISWFAVETLLVNWFAIGATLVFNPKLLPVADRWFWSMPFMLFDPAMIRLWQASGAAWALYLAAVPMLAFQGWLRADALGRKAQENREKFLKEKERVSQQMKAEFQCAVDKARALIRKSEEERNAALEERERILITCRALRGEEERSEKQVAELKMENARLRAQNGAFRNHRAINSKLKCLLVETGAVTERELCDRIQCWNRQIASRREKLKAQAKEPSGQTGSKTDS